jgi:ribosomal protein S18 acetylase RimI-like enzyme
VATDLRLNRVYANQIDALKEYVAALYAHDEDYDSMVNIEEGVNSLMRNEHLATPYFIQRGSDRVGYVILTKYHSVEKGGLTYYIDELYVEESERRGGIGHEIMGKILEIAQADGAKNLWAQVERHNLAAQAFFTTHGFTVDPNINFERAL